MAADAPRKDLRFKVRIKVYGQGLGEPSWTELLFFYRSCCYFFSYVFIVFYVLIMPFVLFLSQPLPIIEDNSYILIKSHFPLIFYSIKRYAAK